MALQKTNSGYPTDLPIGFSREAYDALVHFLREDGGGAALNSILEDGYESNVNWGGLLDAMRKQKASHPPVVDPFYRPGGVVTPAAQYGHPMFHQIIKEVLEIHERKNKQYATEDDPLGNFRRTGRIIAKFLKPGLDPTMASLLSFMSKQVDGVYEMFAESKTDCPDQLEDKLLDIVVYGIIGMILIRESRSTQK